MLHEVHGELQHVLKLKVDRSIANNRSHIEQARTQAAQLLQGGNACRVAANTATNQVSYPGRRRSSRLSAAVDVSVFAEILEIGRVAVVGIETGEA